MSGEERKNLLFIRGFYFMSFGALGALFPFLPILFDSRGLSPIEISWIMVLIPLANLVIPPIWGMLADTMRARVPLLVLACVACALTCLAFIPDYGFWGFVAAMTIFSIFRSPIIALADATSYDILGKKTANYSTIRVWGSIGFVILVFSPGAFSGEFQIPAVLAITSVAYLLAGTSTAFVRGKKLEKEKNVIRQSLKIAKKPEVLLFLIANAVYYSGHATYDSCISLHFKMLGYDELFIGTAWALGVTIEIILMFLAPRFIGKIRSGTLLMVCAAVAAIRWFSLSITTDPYLLLLSQSLHAVTFGLFYLSIVKFTQEHAPDHLRASLQSVTVSFLGVGMVAGYLAGGQLLERFGGFVLYRGAMVSAILALIIYGVTVLIQSRKSTQKSE